MSKLTWRNAAHALAWCIGLWIVTMFGMILAGFICGALTSSEPQHAITVIKYVTRPASSAAIAPVAQNGE